MPLAVRVSLSPLDDVIGRTDQPPRRSHGDRPVRHHPLRVQGAMPVRQDHGPHHVPGLRLARAGGPGAWPQHSPHAGAAPRPGAPPAPAAEAAHPALPSHRLPRVCGCQGVVQHSHTACSNGVPHLCPHRPGRCGAEGLRRRLQGRHHHRAGRAGRRDGGWHDQPAPGLRCGACARCLRGLGDHRCTSPVRLRQRRGAPPARLPCGLPRRARASARRGPPAA